MPWVKKVGRHVVVQVVKTVAGNTTYVKRRPAQITALGAGNLVTCKVTGGETYTLIDRDLDLTPPRVTSTYISTG